MTTSLGSPLWCSWLPCLSRSQQCSWTKSCHLREYPERSLQTTGPASKVKIFLYLLITCTASSPLYNQWNRFIEWYIKTLKWCFTEAKMPKIPLCMVLFHLANTPIGCNLSNPTEITHGQCYNSLHPNASLSINMQQIPEAFIGCQTITEGCPWLVHQSKRITPYTMAKKPFKMSTETIADDTPAMSQVGPEPRNYCIKTQTNWKYHRNRRDLKLVNYIDRIPIARPSITKPLIWRPSHSTSKVLHPTISAKLPQAAHKAT